MKEVVTKKWECSCGMTYSRRDECERCEKDHAEINALVKVGSEFWIDIGGPGAPSMMGGQPSGHETKWTKGVVVKFDGEKVLVEHSNGIREWWYKSILVNDQSRYHYATEPHRPVDATAMAVFVGLCTGSVGIHE